MQLARTTVLLVTCVLTGPLRDGQEDAGPKVGGERYLVLSIPQIGILRPGRAENQLLT